jgi:uncharacterized protein (DUF1330 family)
MVVLLFSARACLNPLGPDAATLAALAALPDDKPLVMLNLLAFTDGGETYQKYANVALPQIEKRGGRVLYQGTPLRDDPQAGHWDSVAIVLYPSRSAFLDMIQDPDYRSGLADRKAGLARTMVYAFTQGKAPGVPATPKLTSAPGRSSPAGMPR